MSQGEEGGANTALLAAQQKFQDVLQGLENNLAIVAERSKTVKSIEDHALVLTNERTQLHAKVNNMTQRLEGLEAANLEVSNRLAKAMETVRSVLQESGE